MFLISIIKSNGKVLFRKTVFSLSLWNAKCISNYRVIIIITIPCKQQDSNRLSGMAHLYFARYRTSAYTNLKSDANMVIAVMVYLYHWHHIPVYPRAEPECSPWLRAAEDPDTTIHWPETLSGWTYSPSLWASGRGWCQTVCVDHWSCCSRHCWPHGRAPPATDRWT